jgi:hypothetical protein
MTIALGPPKMSALFKVTSAPSKTKVTELLVSSTHLTRLGGIKNLCSFLPLTSIGLSPSEKIDLDRYSGHANKKINYCAITLCFKINDSFIISSA